ncbi:YhgE/Pip domain-containing protein [Corynebacterium pacaense]|uniref:YhgE/Pip domain-containing protein n=1 Tax=Corynebacterium pacaense TaxID=1816684 RepID=UPI0009BA5FD5|nr:YhgE/Pip domain-containing protein [Corynebacterium pacaense]
MSLLHMGTELTRFARGKLPPLGFVVVMLLPLLFGGVFVWAYYDPISGLSKLPVAVVNQDDGVTLSEEAGGGQLNAGEQVVQQLEQLDTIHFIPVSADDAREGINDGTYYFGIEIPSDFSSSIASVTTDSPQQATVNAVFNNSNGFIASMLGNQVVNTVISTMDGEFGAQVVDNILVGFSTIGDGMNRAADGAGQLADGASSAQDGAGQLADGATQLHDGILSGQSGANQLADGAAALDTGLGTAASGSQQLSDGLNTLSAGTRQLGTGASAVSQGVDTLVSTVSPLINISTQLRASGVPGAAQIADQIDHTIAEAAGGADLNAQLETLRAGAAQIADELDNPASTYRAGVDSAVSASAQLAAGLAQLKDGSSQLSVGARTLADGTGQLAAGSEQLVVGAAALRDGTVQLDEGSGQLALQLSQGAEKIPSFADNAGQTISTPVGTRQDGDITPKFGIGLSPFFMCVGLFMGATVTWMLIHPRLRRALDSPMGGFRGTLASYLPGMLMGTGQASVMWLVLNFLLDLNPQHHLGLWISMVAISWVFVSITHMFNNVAGPTAGRVLSIVLMSFQLVASGGLYPPETQAAFFRWFHHYDPITYAVNLIRQMIFNPDPSGDPRFMQAIIVLAFVWALMLAISSVANRMNKVLTMKDYHPELSI